MLQTIDALAMCSDPKAVLLRVGYPYDRFFEIKQGAHLTFNASVSDFQSCGANVGYTDSCGDPVEYDTATVSVVTMLNAEGRKSVLLETWSGNWLDRRTSQLPTYAALKSIKNEDVKCVTIDPDRVECSAAVNEIIAMTVAAKLTGSGQSPHFVQSYAALFCANYESHGPAEQPSSILGPEEQQKQKGTEIINLAEKVYRTLVCLIGMFVDS
jgi:hypothetical protein